MEGLDHRQASSAPKLFYCETILLNCWKKQSVWNGCRPDVSILMNLYVSFSIDMFFNRGSGCSFHDASSYSQGCFWTELSQSKQNEHYSEIVSPFVNSIFQLGERLFFWNSTYHVTHLLPVSYSFSYFFLVQLNTKYCLNFQVYLPFLGHQNKLVYLHLMCFPWHIVNKWVYEIFKSMRSIFICILHCHSFFGSHKQ